MTSATATAQNATATQPAPKLLACQQTHEQALRLIAALRHDGWLLDLGAGEGPLSLKLREMGCRVIAADLQPDMFQVENVPLVQSDVSSALPFRDGSIQGLCSLECIEHLEDQFRFIRECHRVLQRGGWLLLSTPNITGLASRVTYLLSAMYPLARRPLNEFRHAPESDHINLISYPILRYILHRNGFRLRTVCTDRWRRSSLFWVFLLPFVYLCTYHAFSQEADPRQRKENREIARHLLSSALLFGRTLIVVAEKV